MSTELMITIIATGTGVIAAIAAGYWAIGNLVLAQFDKRLDERFAAQERMREEGRKQWDARFGVFETEQRRIEREVLELKADLPMNYVRREDHIRFETVINAKLDALYSELRLVGERQKRD